MPIHAAPTSAARPGRRLALGVLLLWLLAGLFAGCAGRWPTAAPAQPTGQTATPVATQAAAQTRQSTQPEPSKPGTAESAQPQTQTQAEPPAGPGRPGEAQWRTTGEALGLGRPAPAEGEGDPATDPGPTFTPEGLAGEVAARCAAAGGRRGVYLPALTAELFAAGIPAADATEALIRGDCGSLADLVRTMVATGGEGALAPVVGRALFLAGPQSEGIIAAAASAGLQRGLGGPARSPDGDSMPRLNGYAMAYFPSGADTALRTGAEVSPLYNLATPGYGIYTYVLLGKGFPDLPEADTRRYREVLRLIQTYVMASDPQTRGPSAQTHTFLLAVYPGRKGLPLMEQTGPELSTDMREALADYIDALGDTVLAKRVRTSPGPFLVSAAEPRLIPGQRTDPRLVVDLSGLAPEYLYALVDAYDRPLSEADLARAGGLDPIDGRLAELFRVAGPSADPAGGGRWVYRLGAPAAAPAAATAAPPTQAAPGTPATPAKADKGGGRGGP